MANSDLDNQIEQALKNISLKDDPNQVDASKDKFFNACSI